MVLLILAVVWILVLAPAGWKKLSSRRSGASIESFHHELRLLKHSGPKLIAPAFRLETAQSAAVGAARSGYPVVSSMPGRAPLVLVPAGGESAGPARSPAGGTLPGGSLLADGWAEAGTGAVMPSRRAVPPAAGWEAGRPVERWASTRGAGGRRGARRRRRNILGALAGTVAATGLLGLAPPLHAAWVLTALSVAALACYLGLAAYAANLAVAPPLVASGGAARSPGYAGGWYRAEELARHEGGWGEDQYGDPYGEDAGWWQEAAAR